MIIDKEIVSKIPRDYAFITGIFDIDAKYFKKRTHIKRPGRHAKHYSKRTPHRKKSRGQG